MIYFYFSRQQQSAITFLYKKIRTERKKKQKERRKKRKEKEATERKKEKMTRALVSKDKERDKLMDKKTR